MQVRRDFDQRPEASLPRESFGELLGQLANNSAALVRDEIQLAKQEMSEKVSVFRSGIFVVATGSLIGLVAILALTAAAIIGLANYVGPGYSALIIGGTLAIVGGVTASVGLGQIKRISLTPSQTIETLEEDKEWLKELT
ncbi:MAG: phage holin family protein [Acidobacteriota bacterium]|jgi:Putative Actinobacterial Holin-X, holin superfamily III